MFTIFVLMLLIILLFILYVTYHNADGVYFSNTNFIYCKNEYACFHEIGHLLDYKKNNISLTTEFDEAINEYFYRMVFEIYYDNATIFDIKTYGELQILYERNNYNHGLSVFVANSEIYATIYAKYNGVTDDMPIEFQRFYK